jgi:anti-sigma factor RsiW
MHESDAHLSPADEADLVALADGNLDAVRRLEVEARVAAEPGLAGALCRQRAALALLSTAGAVTMPPQLRARVIELERRRTRVRRWIPAFGAAMAAATAAIALMLASGGPDVDDVISAALRPATAEAAPREQIDGLRFPSYERWRAVGVRADEIGGRATRTVFYERGGRRVAYTIVARPALSEGKRVRRVDGRAVVQWTRAGRTCLVSGDVSAAVLLRLVARSGS